MYFLICVCVTYIFRPKMSEQERRKIVTRMDMSPISMEYETELK